MLELVEQAFRMLGRIFIDIFVETILQGIGYLVQRYLFLRKSPSDTTCLVTGFAVLGLVVLVAINLYST